MILHCWVASLFAQLCPVTNCRCCATRRPSRMLSRWRNCCDLHVTPWTTSPTQRTTTLWTTLTPESHVEPVAQLLRSPRDPMDNITNPADNNLTPESHVEPVAQLLRSPRDPMDNITNPADNNIVDNTNARVAC
ncbi:hypothetical protein niasHS_000148 [Heterodera schachtii]|uniref:Secreted protein n=1 Tax=Heterodera schachtii TaxID=97005 RepID=A0ABD2KP99_HETSC